ncbi:MAG: sigma-70 family RNA polymerase sigma factor [Pseudolabrys sp.]
MAGGANDGGANGKARQFRDLVLPHLDDVYTLARFLTDGASEAEDAAQECFLRAFRHFDSYRGPAIKPWLLAILRNACRAVHAKNAGLVYTDAGTADVAGAAPPIWSEPADTPERLVLRQHDTDAMRRLIENLPPEFREVIVLREINDLSYREIATVIDVPIGTVMSRLARGRALLRDTWIAAEGDLT